MFDIQKSILIQNEYICEERVTNVDSFLLVQ